MSKLTFLAIGLLVLIVIGLGTSGTISAMTNGYHKIESNPIIQKLQSQAEAKIQPEVQKLVSQVTSKINLNLGGNS